MNLRVIYEEKAIDQAAGFLADDPAGLGALLDAVDRLADDPRPAESFPYGSPDLRRLRVGRYRVMYGSKATRWNSGVPPLFLVGRARSRSRPRRGPVAAVGYKLLHGFWPSHLQNLRCSIRRSARGLPDLPG